MTLLANIGTEAVLAFVLGAAFGWGILVWKENLRKKREGLEKEDLLTKARAEASEILNEAKAGADKESANIISKAESFSEERSGQLKERESLLKDREQLVNEQLSGINAREGSLTERNEALDRRESDINQEKEKLQSALTEQIQALEGIAQLTADEARTQLLEKVQNDSLAEANTINRRIIEDAKNEAEDKARFILSTAIQRYAADHTFETTTATLALPSPDLKGRIIGREGRNIRAFESATGITVLIDDTPNAVVLSGFDPVRREIAREAMHRLIQDGRIHPTRIEEVVAKVEAEVDNLILDSAKDAAHRAHVAPVNNEILKVLGRLRFRLSYSQNVLDHSVEVAHLAALMAEELGLDPDIARRAGLLHDIGKSLSQEMEGSHAIVGAEFVKRHGESPAVVDGVASHHDEVPHETPYGILISAADAISAARPGARSESMTTYIKRLENLEKIGASFDGVEKSFAIHAGRELRIMVRPETLDDEAAYKLARSVSRRIEDELQYPGQIRVTVIRETRVVEFAK